MNNSKRSVIFAVSFLTVMYIFAFVMPNYDAFFGDTFRFINGGLFLIIILYPTIQMLMRYIYGKYGLKRDHEFFTLSIKENMIYYRLINLLFIGLLLGYPIVKGLLTPELISTYIKAVLVWIIIAEGLIQITARTTKAIFAHRQLIIIGLDFRIDMPVGDGLKSHSGVYPYKDFTYFTYNNGVLSLNLYDGIGKINVKVDEDMSKQVISYLGSKKIKYKEHHRD